jgi:hypothetical protein
MSKAKWLVVLVVAFVLVPSAWAGGKAELSAKDVNLLVAKARAYLKTSQSADGSFSPKIAGPGVTAVVVAGLLRCGVSPDDPVVEAALKYLEKQVQKDGGIYSKGLANYITSVGVMAFKEANTRGQYDSILANAAKFLKTMQQDGDQEDLKLGGFGYDGKSRPDTSNTNFTIEALLAAGVPKDDPAIQKALKFLGRCQNLPGEFNDQPFAKKAEKGDVGGFVYNPFDVDSKRDKTESGGLRSLGGMTYGGLKSFLYAGVSKEDTRVKAAVNWVRKHYTLDENPGMGKAGLYYYYQTFAKAMDALGEDPFADAAGTKHAWRTELFEALKSRQQENGSWVNAGDKQFAEFNADLATGFALLSLSYTPKK